LNRNLNALIQEKTVTIALCHPLRMRIGHSVQAVFERKGIAKQEVNQGIKEKHWK